MKIQEFVDGAFYINLDYREDRNDLMKNQLIDLGLDNIVERISAVSVTNSTVYSLDNQELITSISRATAESHRKIIKIAKEKKYKNVLILEDDALFYSDDNIKGIEVIEKSLDDLNKIPNWEIFFLGTNIHDKTLNLVSNNIIKCDCCVSTHAYILNENSYDKLLSIDLTRDYAMDLWIDRNLTEKYVSYPMAVPQRGGDLSDIGGHPSVGPDFWKKHYEKPIIRNF
jgi:GR25 family glycosyltransferase involved in LPS biosynthesis